MLASKVIFRSISFSPMVMMMGKRGETQNRNNNNKSLIITSHDIPGIMDTGLVYPFREQERYTFK